MKKKPYLVVYDYGQGGVWAYVMARSAKEIRQLFPELKVVRDAPRWMSQFELEDLRKRALDIESPHDLLANIQANRGERRGPTARTAP